MTLQPWTAAEQAQHRADLLSAFERPYKPKRRPVRKPKPKAEPKPRKLPSSPLQPTFANVAPPKARHAKGRTLDELLGEW